LLVVCIRGHHANRDRKPIAGKGSPNGLRMISYEHAQRVYNPTGAYAGDSETGTIDLDMNRVRTAGLSLRL
jgi:hypothetical protein